MWEPFNGEDVTNYTEPSQKPSAPFDSQSQPWLKSIFNTVRKYKRNLFGESESSVYIKRQRFLDYTIPANYKFVLAKYEDGMYRPASIVGRSKKLQLFIGYFYHNKKCCYVKSRDLIIRHGNLLERKVCFFHEGQNKAGKVYGNNSPANHGFPSLFYIRKHGKWFKISFKKIFLTRKQINKMYFVTPKKRSAVSIQSRNSLGNST